MVQDFESLQSVPTETTRKWYMASEYINVERETFGNPIFQKVLQN